MSAETAHIDQLTRLVTAVILTLMAVAQFVRPRCFVDVGIYFRNSCRGLSAQTSEQVRRTLDARREVEGDSAGLVRYVAVFYLAMAALEFVPAVPFAVPYAAGSLALSLAIYAAYAQVRRATQRRVAPLVRRSPFDALPPVVVAAVAACFAGTLAFGVYAPYATYRIAAIAVAVTVLILFLIAWQIARSPALLLGNDPQVEYAVDERVRLSRATNVTSLACAPAAVLTMLVSRHVAAGFPGYATITAIVCAAFAVTLIVSLMPMRKRLVIA